MEEKECYNCEYMEFDIGLCTQYFCRFHEKLIRHDDSCRNWLNKDNKKNRYLD